MNRIIKSCGRHISWIAIGTGLDPAITKSDSMLGSLIGRPGTLPPVLEKLVRRLTVLEKQHDELVKLVDHLLEALSSESDRVDSNAG